MKRYLKKNQKYFVTGSFVVIALILSLIKYSDYLSNPWTRNGQVQADVVQVAARVSGPIVNLVIVDNQFVKAGDLLFEIDPRTFQAKYDRALAELDATSDNVVALDKQVDASVAHVSMTKASIKQAKRTILEIEATVEKNKSLYERQKNLYEKNSTSKQNMELAKADYEVSVQKKLSAEAKLNQTIASLSQSEANMAKAVAELGELGDKNPQIRAALAAFQQAELNLEFTQVRASVDGYVTNLSIRPGTQAVANKPLLALVDVNSYWVDGFFKENTIANIKAGNKAVVTLMTYSDTPIEGVVNSIGWGIAQKDGSTGSKLLPNINPTFEWIRLAQRIPVKIYLTNIPENIKLRIGTTCSVLIMTGTKTDDEINLVAVPKALQ